MSERIIIKTWAKFKKLKSELAAAGVGYEFFELEEKDRYYHLKIVNDTEFTFWLEKGTADETDYLANVNPDRKILIEFEERTVDSAGT